MMLKNRCYQKDNKRYHFDNLPKEVGEFILKNSNGKF